MSTYARVVLVCFGNPWDISRLGTPDIAVLDPVSDSMAFDWLRMEVMRTGELVWCVIEISAERLSNGQETSDLDILGHAWGLSLTVPVVRPAFK